jgi:carbon storage regulator
MLVLSRKEKQAILIADNITITVLEIKGNKVSIGIEAPGSVTVHRLEVVGKIRDSKGDK